MGSYPFRFSFVVIFLVLYLAAQGVQQFEREPEVWKISTVFIAVAGMFLAFYMKSEFDYTRLLAGVVFLFIYAIIFMFIGYVKQIAYVLPVILSLELVYNGVYTFSNLFWTGRDISEYQSYVSGSEKIVQDIKAQETDLFYRMDTLQKRYNEKSRCSDYLIRTRYILVF